MSNPTSTSQAASATAPVLVAAFYHFAELPDFATLRAPLEALCRHQGVRGTLLLAPEGINGTLAGPVAGVRAALARLRAHPRLTALEHKESHAREIPFRRLKVRLKREIISLGVAGLDPAAGARKVPPGQWNALISDPEVLVLDTRNEYEVVAGTFKNAVNPAIDSFGGFPGFVEERLDPRKHRRIAMFCTGGIRCEKASAYLHAQGFPEVYQLEGGILKYLEEIPAQASLWEGDCFVFDERVAVGHGLSTSDWSSCRACGYPLSARDRASPGYVEGAHCDYCRDRAA